MDPAASTGGGAPAPSTTLFGGAPPAAPAAAAAPAPAGDAWVNPDGNWAEGWHNRLGDEFKDNPTLATIKSPAMLAKAYLDTKKLVGDKVPVRPGPGAKPEEIARWRQLNGSPEKPEDYGSLMPEGFQKELWDPEMEKGFAQLAHEHHLPPDTAKAIAKLHADGMKGVYEREVAAAQQQLEAGKTDLQQAWGLDYARHEAAVKQLATYLGIPLEHDMFRDPAVMKAFAAKAPSVLGGDKIVNGQPAGIAGGITERIDAIHKSEDYQGVNGPERQTAAATELRRLYQAQKV